MTTPTIRELEAAYRAALAEAQEAVEEAKVQRQRVAELLEEAERIERDAMSSEDAARAAARCAEHDLWATIRAALGARRLSRSSEAGAAMTVGPLYPWLTTTESGYRATCQYRGDTIREDHADPVEAVRALLRRLLADPRLGASTRAAVAAHLARLGGDP